MIPKQLKDLKFCRIKRGSKAPFENNWPTNPYSYNEILKFKDENYGVLCGYRNLAVIDCDEEALSFVVSELLPQTFSVKTGGGGFHFYYFIPKLEKKIIIEADGKHLGEIQFKGQQVVGAGSLHPSGNKYEVIDNVGIKTITLEDLEKVLGKFVEKEKLVLDKKVDVEDYKKLIGEIVKVWKEGDRQELALSVSGYLRKDKRLGINKVKSIIKEVCEITEDEELKMRLGAVEETFKKDEKKVKGFTGLKKVDLVKGLQVFTDKRQLAKQFLDQRPLYYDENKLWWVWNAEEYFYERIDDVSILNSINESFVVDTINSKQRVEIIESLKQEGRKLKPKSIKDSWVQFKDKIYDIETDEEFEASPEFFVVNPISWELGKSEETPEIDKLFSSWVTEEDKELLYEMLAFCLAPKYFIHRIFSLIGSGSNGKSTFLKILTRFVGQKNVTASSLNLIIKERFEGSKLLNKLVCLMGETNFGLITNTSFLKNLTGEDLVRCEFKGKDVFDFENYAKLIMATNSLPPTADRTDGYYRRWKIIDFSNKFLEEKDVFGKIPDKEFNNLGLKCLNIVKRLWKHRKFTGDVDFDERRKLYEEKANPLMKFLEENYEQDINREVLFADFFREVRDYFKEKGIREISAISISRQLKSEGFDILKLTKNDVSGKFVLGIYKKNVPNVPNVPLSYSTPYVEESEKKGHLEEKGHSQRELGDQDD